MSTRGSDLVVSITAATLTLCVGRAEAKRAIGIMQTEADMLFVDVVWDFIGSDDNGHPLVKLSTLAGQRAAARRAAVLAAARAVRDRLKPEGIVLRVVE